MKSKYISVIFLVIFFSSYFTLLNCPLFQFHDKQNKINLSSYQEENDLEMRIHESQDWLPIERSFTPNLICNSLNSEMSSVFIEFDCNTKDEIKNDGQITEVTSFSETTDPFEGLLENFHDSETPQPSYVFPPDDRNKVYTTTSYPWRTICKLYITANDHAMFIGSGAIIDQFHVLTCGHCVYLHDHGGWADQIEVVPAMDGYYWPYGSSIATYYRTYTGWTDLKMPEHDWAVLTIDKSLGLFTGWMGRQTADYSSSIYTGMLNTAGYPGDLEYGEYMYATSDNGDRASDYNHWYWLDSAGGQSGSPVWRYDGINRYILSIHAYEYLGGVDANFGTRLDTNKFNDINTWLSQDSASPPNDKAELLDRDAYSAMSTTSVIAGESNFHIFCDVENTGTLSASNFNVKFYASEDSYITSSDYLIGITTIQSLDAFDYIETDWQGIFPSSVPAGEYHVGWIIDEVDSIDEYNENNNVVIINYETLHVQEPPFNPIGIIIGVSVAGLIFATFAYIISSTTRKIPDLDFGFDYSTYFEGYYAKIELKTEDKMEENK